MRMALIWMYIEPTLLSSILFQQELVWRIIFVLFASPCVGLLGSIAYSIAVIASYAIIIPNGAIPFSLQRISGMYVTTGRVVFLRADDLQVVVKFLRRRSRA